MITIYDLETTGLIRLARKDLPGIIQIAAIKYDIDGNEIDVYQRRVDPELLPGDWEQGAINVTGIGPNEIGSDWPSFYEIFSSFADFVQGSTALGGYNNIHFDDIVLFNNLVRYGFEKNFPWPRLRFDVMNVAKARNAINGKKGNTRPKLTALYKELFGEDFEGAHDALNDVRATGKVGFAIGEEDIKRILG